MSRASRLFPVAAWMPAYESANLRPDVIAGITVAALVVPKALGYAGIAKVPLENGLYAAAAGCLVYALFATSRQISTNPSSSLAAVAGSAVLITGVTAEQAPELVAAITILTGALFLALAIFKMGWISQFLSKAVVTGFLFGAAIDVVVGELPKLTGTEATGDTSWQQLASWLETIGSFHTPTVVVGLASVAGILLLRFTAPRVPGALALVVAGLLASALLDMESRDIAVVGDVPRGLPLPALPDASLVVDHFATISASAIALLMIGFSQTAGDARMFAARHQYRIDVNQESVAQGMSNLTSGLFQGMPVSTSLSASSLNDSAGARTPLASITTGAVVILTLLFLAPLFSDLPKAVLGALIIDAVVFGMMDVPEMRRLWRVKRFDFWIAVSAIVAVLSFGVLAGVIVGMALSLGWLVYVSAHPSIPALGQQPGTTAYRPLREFPDGTTVPGLLVVRFDAGLFFVTADVLEERLRQAVISSDEPITGAIIDFAGVNYIDSQGSAELGKIASLATRVGVSLRLARVKPEVMSVLQADGVDILVGLDRFHGNVDEAVQAELRSAATADEAPRA